MHWLSQTLRGLVGQSAADSDAALLARYAAAGDGDAFAAVVGRHAPMVYRVCRGVLDSDHDAEDAAQATFLVLARDAARVRKLSSLSSWLHGVALRSARCHRRRDGRARRREAAAPVRGSAPDAFDELSVREAREILHEELDALPEHYKSPLVLIYLEDRSHEEAAAALGWTPTSFRGKLERARAELGKRLSRRKLTLAATLTAAVLTIQVPAALSAMCSAAAVGTAAAPVAAGIAAQVSTVTGAFTAVGVTGAATAVAVAVAVGAATLVPRPGPPPRPLFVTPASPAAWNYHVGHIIMATEFGFHVLNPDGGTPAAISPPLAEGVITRFRAAPDGKSLSFERAVGRRREVLLWRYDEPFPGRVVGVEFGPDDPWRTSPDGRLAAGPIPAGEGRTGVRVIDARTRRTMAELEGGDPVAVAWSPDSLAVLSLSGGAVTVWRVDGTTPSLTLRDTGVLSRTDDGRALVRGPVWIDWQ